MRDGPARIIYVPPYLYIEMETTAQNGIDGIEAAYLALKDGGVRLAAGVPGYPVSGLFERLRGDAALRAEWAFGEKTAYELAVGASVTGNRAAVIAKHVGINAMADPLVVSATHGIGSGIVVIAGDDVGALQSSNEQDSRWYGKLADIPVFDPATPSDLYDSILGGLGLSERIAAPVIVRVVEGVLAKIGPVARRPLSPSHKTLDQAAWDYTMYGKRQKYLRDGWSIAAREAERSPLNAISRRGPVGIVSSGRASAIAAPVAEGRGLSHLALGLVNPLPRGLVGDFLAGLDAVLVCEEASPLIEEQVHGPNVRGRLTGHLPRAGPLDEAAIHRALDEVHAPAGTAALAPETLAGRGYAMGPCAGCPWVPAFAAIRSLGVPVAGDVGCSILAANPPYRMLDAALALGSSAAVACGFGRKGIALLGDFALLHSGLSSLLDAKYHGREAVVVVLANRLAAMTGGPEVPDVAGLLSDVFKGDCVVRDAAGLSAESIAGDLKRLLAMPSLKVYVLKAACPPVRRHEKLPVS